MRYSWRLRSFIEPSSDLPRPQTPRAAIPIPRSPYEVASQLSLLLGTLPTQLSAAAADSAWVRRRVSSADQALTRAARGQANIEHRPRLVQHQSVYSKVHDPALLASLPTSEQDQSAIERSRKLYPEVRRRRSLEGLRQDRRLPHVTDVCVNQRLAALYPGLTFASSARRQRCDVRGGDLAGVPGACGF